MRAAEFRTVTTKGAARDKRRPEHERVDQEHEVLQVDSPNGLSIGGMGYRSVVFMRLLKNCARLSPLWRSTVLHCHGVHEIAHRKGATLRAFTSRAMPKRRVHCPRVRR